MDFLFSLLWETLVSLGTLGLMLFGFRMIVGKQAFDHCTKFLFLFVRKTIDFAAMIKSLFSLLFGSRRGTGFIKPSHKSLSGDGMRVAHKSYLTRSASMAQSLTIAAAGSGKTQSVLIPAVFDLASKKAPPSLVLTDPKGAIFEVVSGYLEKQGYKIKVIRPEELDRSNRFNPLFYVNTVAEYKQLSDSLLKAAEFGGTSGQSIWSRKACDLVSLMISVVKRMPPEFQHLGNVHRLVQMIGDDGEALIPLFAAFGDQDPIYLEWKSLMAKNEEFLVGIVGNAEAMLEKLSDPNLSHLMASNDLELEELRGDQPTALFLIFPAQKAQYYGFLASLLYKRVFDLSTERLDPKARDLYCLLDEFTNCPAIPDFANILTYIREFGVSINLFLQASSQLEKVYGLTDSRSIIDGGCSTKIWLGKGIGSDDAYRLSQRLGVKEGKRGTESIMEAHQLEQMPMGSVIVQQRGLPPAKLSKRSFDSYRKFRKWAALPAAVIENQNSRPVAWVDPDRFQIIRDEPEVAQETILEENLEPSPETSDELEEPVEESQDIPMELEVEPEVNREEAEENIQSPTTENV